MTLDPWHEPGIPLEEQYRSWKQRIKAPYDKHEVDAYTRTRVILMNGVEVGAWNFSHHFARSTDDFELRSLLARTRMVDQQQQTTINWLHPADQSVLETAIAYEQVAIDLTAYFARNEPGPFVREAFNASSVTSGCPSRTCRPTGPRTGTRRSSTPTGSHRRRSSICRRRGRIRPSVRGASCWPGPARLPSRSDSEREAGVNKQVLLDKLSEFLMVEQCGWQLYRVVESRATDKELKERYQEFGQETDRHRTILTRLIGELGGDPDYVSPTARVAQAKSEALLQSALVSGPLGQAEREASDLENVLLAETKDHADWELLGQLAEQLPNGKAKTAIEAAVAEVGPEEDEHLGWAQTKLAELALRAVMDEAPPDPARLDRCVIQPEMKIKATHAAPMDKRNLLEGAKLPSAQPTPTSRTSSPSR